MHGTVARAGGPGRPRAARAAPPLFPRERREAVKKLPCLGGSLTDAGRLPADCRRAHGGPGVVRTSHRRMGRITSTDWKKRRTSM